MKKIIPILFIAMVLSSCNEESKKPLLIGQWQGVSWTLRDKETGRDAKSVTFVFANEDKYSASFGTLSEGGTYRLSKDMLYTTGENKIEKMVKLSKITADTIIMEMNRMGDAEELVLVKKL